MRTAGWTPIGITLVLVFTACDALLVEPGNESAQYALGLSVVGDTVDYSDLIPVLAKVDQVSLQITSDAGTRDTTVYARFETDSVSIRLQLRPEEALGWVHLDATLLGEGWRLFQAEILDFAHRVAPERAVVVTPIVATIDMDLVWPELEAVGDTLVVRSLALFATRDTLHGVTVEWSSADPGVLERVGSDRFVARNNGAVAVTGRVLGKEVTRSAVVAQRPIVLTGVSPVDTTIAVGDQFYIRPFGEDANGHALRPGARLPWVGGGAAVVNLQGFVTGRTEGTDTVQVTFGGMTRSVRVTVTPS